MKVSNIVLIFILMTYLITSIRATRLIPTPKNIDLYKNFIFFKSYPMFQKKQEESLVRKAINWSKSFFEMLYRMIKCKTDCGLPGIRSKTLTSIFKYKKQWDLLLLISLLRILIFLYFYYIYLWFKLCFNKRFH